MAPNDVEAVLIKGPFVSLRLYTTCGKKVDIIFRQAALR
jgi:hypothetical protein